MGLFLVIAGPLLLMLIGLAVFFMMAGNRRMQQGTLLWQLAIAIEKGFPLHAEVEALASCYGVGTRRRLVLLGDRLRMGLPLPDALEQSPGLVPRSAVTAAHVGAESGSLAQAMRDAAIEHTNTQQRQFLGSFSPGNMLAYLTVMITMAQIIVSFLMYYVIPKFKKIFEDFGVELPGWTKTIITLSDFVVDYFYLLFPVVMLPTAMLVVWAVGYYRGWGEFDVPWISRWFARFDTPGVLRNLAASITADRPADRALATIATTHRRKNVRMRAEQARVYVVEGADIWEALHAQRFLNKHEAALLKSAQRAGNLPWALAHLAGNLERRLTFRLMAAGELVQPAIVLLIGLGVGTLCISLFVPLVKLIDEVS